jgi:hypothetical protein
MENLLLVTEWLLFLYLAHKYILVSSHKLINMYNEDDIFPTTGYSTFYHSRRFSWQVEVAMGIHTGILVTHCALLLLALATCFIRLYSRFLCKYISLWFDVICMYLTRSRYCLCWEASIDTAPLGWTIWWFRAGDIWDTGRIGMELIAYV